jgi:hypothetical protein
MGGDGELLMSKVLLIKSIPSALAAGHAPSMSFAETRGLSNNLLLHFPISNLQFPIPPSLTNPLWWGYTPVGDERWVLMSGDDGVSMSD